MKNDTIEFSHQRHKKKLKQLKEFIQTLDNCETNVFIIMNGNREALCVANGEFYFNETFLGSTSLLLFKDKESVDKFIESVKWYSGEIYNEKVFRGETIAPTSYPVHIIKNHIQQNVEVIQQGIDKIEILLSVFKKEDKSE